MAKTATWWRVSAPYVTVKTGTPQGMRIVGLFTGAPMPFDVPQDTLDHHIAMDLVAEYPVSGAEAAELARVRGTAPAEADPAPLPDPVALAEAEQAAKAKAVAEAEADRVAAQEAAQRSADKHAEQARAAAAADERKAAASRTAGRRT
jgi:hypothetical protein